MRDPHKREKIYIYTYTPWLKIKYKTNKRNKTFRFIEITLAV